VVADWTGISARSGLGAAAAARRLRVGDDLSAIFNQIFVGLVEVDLHGRIISANERFCRLIERRPEAVILEQLRLRDILYSVDVPGYERAMKRLCEGLGAFVLEVRVMTLEKRAIWVEIAASPLLDGRQMPASAVLVVTDVTNRKRAEARASETERRLREVADAAPVFIWTSGTDRRRRHTWVNTRWAEFRGRPMEAELGSGWLVGVHPDDVAACLEAYSTAFDGRGPFKAEYRLRRHDGRRWSCRHSLTMLAFRTLFDLVRARASNCNSSKQQQHAERQCGGLQFVFHDEHYSLRRFGLAERSG
jgi:PAS domain S-box-containing protein